MRSESIPTKSPSLALRTTRPNPQAAAAGVLGVLGAPGGALERPTPRRLEIIQR
jgi:hypothetical protein